MLMMAISGRKVLDFTVGIFLTVHLLPTSNVLL